MTRVFSFASLGEDSNLSRPFSIAANVYEDEVLVNSFFAQCLPDDGTILPNSTQSLLKGDIDFYKSIHIPNGEKMYMPTTLELARLVVEPHANYKDMLSDFSKFYLKYCSSSNSKSSDTLIVHYCDSLGLSRILQDMFMFGYVKEKDQLRYQVFDINALLLIRYRKFICSAHITDIAFFIKSIRGMVPDIWDYPFDLPLKCHINAICFMHLWEIIIEKGSKKEETKE
jgi:hypothetical protein